MPRPSARRAPLADAGPLLLLLLVLAVSAVALHRYGADSVGGADSAGYLAQAHRWRTGALRQPLPFPDLPVQPAAPLQTPLGFRPSPDARATIPVYPPGWPLLLAAALTAGDTAAVRLLPAAAALAALFALFVLGRRLASPWHAVGAVACVASAAPFLFQALQPMSDVPALAGWLMAFAGAGSRTSWGRACGAIAAAAALAIRPNLAPLLLVVAWTAADGLFSDATPTSLPTPDRTAGRPASTRRTRLARAAWICAPALVVAVAYVGWQAVLYGSPFTSGYGTADELFAVRHVATNASRQFAWLVESLGPPTLVLLLLAIVTVWTRAWPPAFAAAIAIGWGQYLVYVPFDNWTYLRFVLLPLCLLMLAGMVAFDRLTRRAPPWLRGPLLAAAVFALVLGNLWQVARLGVLDLHRDEARYRLAATFIDGQRVPGLVVLAGQHSGAIAAYTDLPVLRADLLTPDDAITLLPWLTTHGHSVALLLDEEEARDLRVRLAATRLALDWPPRARVGRPLRTRVWFLDDRAAVQRGERVATVSLWPDARR